VLAVAAFITAGNWRALWPPHAEDNWRQASIDEDFAAVEPDTPVLAVSPFIEAMPPVWSPDYRLPGYLYSPLFVYPVRGRVYPFPFMRSPEAERYADSLLGATLLKRARFVIYGAGLNTVVWVQWFSNRPTMGCKRSPGITPRGEK